MGRLEAILTVDGMVMVSEIVISGASNAAYSLNLKGNGQRMDDIAFSGSPTIRELLPKFSLFSVYRAADYTLINRHQFRMASSQQISFRVKRREDAGEELVINTYPDWQKRNFQLNTGKVGTR